ncbi:MAG: class I SAM-dependent methyltransferase [Bacteroidota bacterium]
MRYDPVKKFFGDVVGSRLWLRRLFYALLGLLFLREWHVKRELRNLLGSSSRPMEVYDAGTGFGQYSYYMAKRFPRSRIYAVDVNEEQVVECRRFFETVGFRHCSFAVEDLLAIQHAGRFDLVLSVDVMEHIEEDRRVFQNLFRALKPGGVLLVNTPSNLGGSDVHAEGEQSFIEEHARPGYGVEEIRTKLESAGFMVERIAFTYGPFGSLAWRLGIKYPMRMLSATKLFFFLLPLYYLVTLPIVLPLMYLDYSSENNTGTGLLVIARKP